MNQPIKLRPCNLCGETKSIEYLYSRNGYDIVRCRICTLVYVDKLPSKEALSRIYDRSFFTIGSKYSSRNDKAGSTNAQKRMDYIRKLRGPQLNALLDIGCATGDFLQAAKSLARVRYGIDISSYAIDIAKQRGLSHVYAGDFTGLSLPEFERRFDVITMWDFIEHLADPRSAFKKAHGFLKPNGCLILSTGDIRTMSARVMGKYWHLMIPPKHTYFFSATSITRYLAEAGFTDIRISYPGKWVPIDFIFYKGLSLLNQRLAAATTDFLAKTGIGALAVPINLFDIMTVSARRPS